MYQKIDIVDVSILLFQTRTTISWRYTQNLLNPKLKTDNNSSVKSFCKGQPFCPLTNKEINL